MKKIFFICLLLTSFVTIYAQTPTPTPAPAPAPMPKTDSLQEYTGTFKFPEGSVVTEITITFDNGMLTVNSQMGSSELKRIQGDVFELVAYSGTTTYKRNAEGKINAITIEVGSTLLEGTKSEKPALAVFVEGHGE